MNTITLELLKMETVEESRAFGMLKVDTQKERISIDEQNNIVIYSEYINDCYGAYWNAERYSFNEWDGLAYV